MKKLRYCDYLGRYFCDGCHGGLESVIPARVLNNWDFARYPVCHFSRQILDSIWQQPLFKLTSVAKNLYSQAKELQHFRVSVLFCLVFVEYTVCMCFAGVISGKSGCMGCYLMIILSMFSHLL